MASRRKKNKGNSAGREAAGKKPRPRRGGPQDSKASSGGPVGQPGGSGLREERPTEAASPPAPESTSSSPPETQQSPTASLPGVFYQRAGRWWWRVQLPGEDKAKARPLKAPDAKAATDDRQKAEQIAFEIWEHAVRENAARQIKLESTEKIERLKAQFLDKVRHFTELVETANARIEAEERARAEAEAKLAQMVQTNGFKTEEPGPGTQDGGSPPAESPVPAPVVPRAEGVEAEIMPPLPAAAMPLSSEVQVPPESGHVFAPPMPVEPVERPIDGGFPIVDTAMKETPSANPPSAIRHPPSPAPSVAPASFVPSGPPPAQAVPPEPPTGACGCCGATGIATTHLTAIDSGQLLCPRCLAAFHADLARLFGGSM